ncbi:hypothetical protein BH11BAC2_BH11BAC2_04780 [soil metagenome]
MKKTIIALFIFLVFFGQRSMATNGDTLTIQTFTFGSPQDAWFVFPSDTVNIEKILMLYTLKCNPQQSPACGEWDYLTSTYLYKKTGNTDSLFHHQPLFMSNGSTPDSIPYINSPSYSYQANWQDFIVHTSTTSLNTYASGTGSTASSYPFGSSASVSRSQYLWKASELTAAGMSSGNITGLQFYLQSTGSLLRNLSIRIANTTADSLTRSTLVATGFITVYSLNTQISSTGWKSLQFTTPFNWNGTSNLVIEITYDNTSPGIDNVVDASTTSFKSGLTNSGDDRTAKFHNGAFIDIPLNPQVAAIDSFVTVCYWAYGDPLLQPNDGTSFEAVDSVGNRILNAHCPWSDSKVYWDAGSVGNTYDRVSKTATALQIKGKWNYWTFMKNCNSGIMKIYCNGLLFFTGSAKTKLMSGIDHFRIGKGNWAGSQSFEGRIDDFAVFNVEIPLTTIQQYMLRTIDPSHPYYNNLVLYYHFDDGNYLTASDAAPVLHDAALLNAGTDNPLKISTELNYNFTESTLRPNVKFEQGVYISYLDSTLVVDSTMNAPIQIITFADSVNNPGVATDTMMVWAPYYNNYIYDAQGNVIDSSLVNANGTLYQAYYDYYSYFPEVERFELGRYITPYGNGLSLGNGWTWTFDVSDYRTLLSDSVHLAAGNWQELLDMKFVIIKGIPPRNVISIQNLWNGNFDYGVAGDPIDNHLTAINASIPVNAAMARWKSRVTGHGMDTPQNCAEFCPKTHYYKVDGVQRYSKLVWRDNCDYNPLYPQGGTWVYDRANWCPGAEVWTYDWEITNWVTPGASFSLDHDVQAYTHTSGWDYYQIEDQLVSYSAPNFTNDAALEDILAPGANQMWQRMNPVCSSPIIKIKNTGSNPLTSLTITYGLNGGVAPSTFTWTGNLAFMQIATVNLGSFNWTGNANQFYAYVSNPNGAADQYAYNDTMKTDFAYPTAMPSSFVIELKTNSAPSENSYTLKDDAGNIVFSRSGLSANTIYSDTVSLANGCYKFELLDTGEDGLTWWANTSQGSGTLRFRNAGVNTIINTFNSDFGGQIYQQFTVGLVTAVQDYILTKTNTMSVYPNPTSGIVNIDFNLTERNDAVIEIYDIVGKMLYTTTSPMITAGSVQVDLSAFPKGVYLVHLKSGNENITKKIILQ